MIGHHRMTDEQRPEAVILQKMEKTRGIVVRQMRISRTQSGTGNIPTDKSQSYFRRQNFNIY